MKFDYRLTHVPGWDYFSQVFMITFEHEGEAEAAVAFAYMMRRGIPWVGMH